MALKLYPYQELANDVASLMLVGQMRAAVIHLLDKSCVLGLLATYIRYLDIQCYIAEEFFDSCNAKEILLSEAFVLCVLPAPRYVMTVYQNQEKILSYVDVWFRDVDGHSCCYQMYANKRRRIGELRDLPTGRQRSSQAVVLREHAQRGCSCGMYLKGHPVQPHDRVTDYLQAAEWARHDCSVLASRDRTGRSTATCWCYGIA